MTGARQFFFAFWAAAFRALAWLPFGLARGLEGLADWCEERAG